MTGDYVICGNNLSVISPYLPFALTQAESFKSRKSRSDFNIFCVFGDDLPLQSGDNIYIGENAKTFRNVEKETRFICSGESSIAATVISVKSHDVYCYVKKSEWRSLLNEQNFWNTVALPHLMLKRGCIVVNAAFVEYKGKGLLLISRSKEDRAGPANLLRKYRGAKIINSKTAGIETNGEIRFHSFPDGSQNEICENLSLPASAIISVEKSEKTAIKKLSGFEADSSLFRCGSIDPSFPDDKRMFHSAAKAITASVPFYSIAAPFDLRAVSAVDSVMKSLLFHRLQ